MRLRVTSVSGFSELTFLMVGILTGWFLGQDFEVTLVTAFSGLIVSGLGGVPREQTMLKGHLPSKFTSIRRLEIRVFLNIFPERQVWDFGFGVEQIARC